MSDELKDFRYYADKAEALIASTAEIFPVSVREGEAVTAIAAIYAELAKAAPKVVNQRKYTDADRVADSLRELSMKQKRQADATRNALIDYAVRSYGTLARLDPNGKRETLQARFRGALDMLAEYLIATGEADHDEGHAVARRLIGADASEEF
jgi:hypothetical protein